MQIDLRDGDPADPMLAALEHGDDVRIAERLVVAPEAGVFRAVPPECVTCEGELVAAGQVVGFVESPGRMVEVRAFCSGFHLGLLAEDGERVTPGRPLVRLRSLDG
ncbi:MAG: hypothetical protein HYX34_15950 [Actinobacteria bacterium]|nr:hypothetical protein [Actinomycetota bacterium]